MKISINKKSVIDGVNRQTALLALKNEGADYIAYNEDDDERVEPLWLGSINELLQLLLPYARRSAAADGAEFLLTLPSNWDDSQSDSLQQLAENFVETALTARWLDNVKPDSAMLMRSLNNSTATAINELLFSRKKIKR